MKADSLHGSFGEKLKSNSEIVDFKKFSDMFLVTEIHKMRTFGSQGFL